MKRTAAASNLSGSFSTPALTAEMMAELFGYDSTEPAIDVDGEEIVDDRVPTGPFLERGSD